MEAWIEGIRANPPPGPTREQLAIEFWQAYQPRWVVGLSKTPHGWKVQIGFGLKVLQKRFPKTASLAKC